MSSTVLDNSCKGARAIIRKQKASVGEDVEGFGTLVHRWWKCKMGHQWRKQYRGSSANRSLCFSNTTIQQLLTALGMKCKPVTMPARSHTVCLSLLFYLLFSLFAAPAMGTFVPLTPTSSLFGVFAPALLSLWDALPPDLLVSLMGNGELIFSQRELFWP